MAFRALLFSKSPESNAALTTACRVAGIRVESCSDIFSAIDKGTKQPFSCIIADWADQPEAGFLLKRARESGPDKNLLAIAIVDNEPTAAEMRDHRLDFLLYRPIDATEAQDVFAKASQKMPSVNTGNLADSSAHPEPEAAHVDGSSASDSQKQAQEGDQDQNQSPHQHADSGADSPATDSSNESENDIDFDHDPTPRRLPALGQACAAILILGAAFFLWRARDVIVYLAHTREDRVTVFKESVSALFYMSPSGAVPVSDATSDAQQDAYFSRSGSASPAVQPPQLAVAATEADLNESHVQLRKATDFPLPTPVYETPKPEPVRAKSTAIPESLRASAPITPPVVVTVNPAQMMPVSSPSPPPASQQFSEPVTVTEETERALLLQSVNPAYPPEALAQKMHGPVVLQATIGRDGSVEDLKIVRGYFVLGKAAIAAVKQWRFQPYTVNGHAAQTQTTLTVTFN